MSREDPDPALDLVAVLAHGWLNSMSIVHTAALTLRESAGRLTPEATEQLLQMLSSQLTFLQGSLRDHAPEGP